MVDALSSGGSECMLVGVQLPPLARAEKGWNPTIPALLLYPKRMKCDKKVLNMRRKPSYLSRNRQTDIHTQNHTSRDRLEKQIRNALQTNPMRPILKKNEIRRTTFPRTQSQAFPGISL